jgi:acylphosphatase
VGAGTPSGGAKARARLVIAGRVQGVAYRQSTIDEARRLGVAGWVRNLPDGRVEVLAEGARSLVEALAAWCRRGPRFARVDHVTVSWEEPVGDLRRFDITG